MVVLPAVQNLPKTHPFEAIIVFLSPLSNRQGAVDMQGHAIVASAAQVPSILLRCPSLVCVCSSHSFVLLVVAAIFVTVYVQCASGGGEEGQVL